MTILFKSNVDLFFIISLTNDDNRISSHPMIKLNMTRVFTLIVVLCFLSIDLCQSAAGRCYQCNSRNSLCGATVNESLKLDSTPCNGQCYTRINRNDENTVYRGCSWEHGFMTAQRTNLLILDAGSVWIFCDTPYCNFESKALLNSRHSYRFRFSQ